MEVLYNIFYELELGLGLTLAFILASGVGTVTSACFAIRMAKRRIKQDYPGLDPEKVKGEILFGNQN